jgi:hypothetical protein
MIQVETQPSADEKALLVRQLSEKADRLQGALTKAEKEKKALSMDLERTRRHLQELREKAVQDSVPVPGPGPGPGPDSDYQAEILKGWTSFFSVRQ